jgi:hypothetical protein
VLPDLTPESQLFLGRSTGDPSDASALVGGWLLPGQDPTKPTTASNLPHEIRDRCAPPPGASE